MSLETTAELMPQLLILYWSSPCWATSPRTLPIHELACLAGSIRRWGLFATGPGKYHAVFTHQRNQLFQPHVYGTGTHFPLTSTFSGFSPLITSLLITPFNEKMAMIPLTYKVRFSRASEIENPCGQINLLLLRGSPASFDGKTTNDSLVPPDACYQTLGMLSGQNITTRHFTQFTLRNHSSALFLLSLIAFLPGISASPILTSHRRANTAPPNIARDSGTEIYSKVLFCFLILGACISTAAYVYEYLETWRIERGSTPSSVGAPNSGEEPSPPYYRMLALNAPAAVWTILCVMNFIMLLLQRPKLVRACEGPNVDIAGLGARLNLWIPAGIVILTAGLGHLHGEITGAKTVHLALFGALVIYECNLLIQDMTPVDQVIGAMVLDCLLMIDSVPTSMKECLSARNIIRLANITQYFGLVVTFVLIQRFRGAVIATQASGPGSAPACDCFQIYWWGMIDSCDGISSSLVVYYLLRATGTLHGSWLSFHYMGLYDECEKVERSECLVPLTRTVKTVYNSIPATAITKYQEWIPAIVFSVTNLELTLMWYKSAQDVKSWGQTASILGVTVTSGSFLYALHMMFKTESVERRQQIIRDYSHGTAFPRLAITTLVKSDMVPLTGLLQKLPAHLLSRSPFGKVRLRSPNHCRLSTTPAAWERITYEYRQWPGKDAEQLGILLIQSSTLGDIKPIRDLLAEGASTTTRDRHGETALHIACKRGSIEIIKALIAGGARLEIESWEGWTALHFAVSGGQVDVLKCFLDLHFNTNTQAKNGRTPLHHAVRGGKLEILRVMLEMKPNLDLGEKAGLTPLHLASELWDAKPALLLLASGANPNLKDKRGYAPLHLAARHSMKGLVERMLDMGADIDVQTGDGSTPLMLAINKAGKKTASVLLERGADPNLKDKRGYAPLHLAARHSMKGLVERLLDMGADIDLQTSNGSGPLLLSCSNAGKTTASLLLERGADPKLKHKSGYTPLHLAARRGMHDLVQRMLDMGVDIDLQTCDGSTPLMLASNNAGKKTVSLLLERGADLNLKHKIGCAPLHLVAARRGMKDLVERMLDMGVDIDLQTGDGSTPLMLASNNASEKTVSLLLGRGADPNLTDKGGYAPLHLAAHQGREGMVEKMIRMGANPGVQSMLGWTPLHYAMACGGGGSKLVSLLLAMKGDPNYREHHGLTPLHVASVLASIEQATVLIKEQHADANAPDQHGLTPLHYSIHYKNYEFSSGLLDIGADPYRKGIHGFTPLQMLPMVSGAARKFLERKMLAINKDPNLSEDNAWTAPNSRTIRLPPDVEISPVKMEGNLNSEDLFKSGHIRSCLARIAEYRQCCKALPSDGEDSKHQIVPKQMNDSDVDDGDEIVLPDENLCWDREEDLTGNGDGNVLELADEDLGEGKDEDFTEDEDDDEMLLSDEEPGCDTDEEPGWDSHGHSTESGDGDGPGLVGEAQGGGTGEGLVEDDGDDEIALSEVELGWDTDEDMDEDEDEDL